MSDSISLRARSILAHAIAYGRQGAVVGLWCNECGTYMYHEPDQKSIYCCNHVYEGFKCLATERARELNVAWSEPTRDICFHGVRIVPHPSPFLAGSISRYRRDAYLGTLP